MAYPTYLFIRYAYFKLRKEFRFKTKFNEYNHIDALVLLSMNVLRTSPEYFREKCGYLKEYIVYLYPESTSFHESLRMAYKDVYRSESIVNWLNRFHTVDERKNVVRFLIHMAAQDGIVAPREKEELFRIIDAFELERREWSDLINEINMEFANRQNRWKKEYHAPNESYRDDLVEKALNYFEMERDGVDERLLREKYRKLVKEYHPDRYPDATAEEHSELEVKFQELQLYYEEILKLL
ncbi:Dna-J like membrane chaperone protein [compost metagenome]